MKKLFLSAFALLAFAGTSFGQFSIKKVLFEEFTGAWCQYCADGAYRAEVMDGNHPNALMVAVHDGDAMEITEGGDLAGFYSPAYPQALFNRNGTLVSRGSWSSTMGSALQGAGSVTVSFDSVAYDMQQRKLTVVVRALFTGNESGDLRLNMAITEDDVTGTGSGYNQVNADNGTVGHPYYGMGNPIVGFKHKHVLRAYLGGTWGDAGIIPATVGLGTSVSHTYTYTVPATWDETKLELVAFVSRFDGTALTDRMVLNGEEFDLSTVTVGRTEMNASNYELEINGNPLTEQSKIVFSTTEAGNYRLEVVNMLGQVVANLGEGFADKGIHTTIWNGQNNAGVAVENGMYLIRLLSENGQAVSKRILVAH